MVTRHQSPTPEEAELARQSMRMVTKYLRQNATLSLQMDDNEVELPPSAIALLIDILEALGSGRGVTLIPEDAELTTVEAADILNVSRPYLIKLLEAGDIPHHKVGTHRRIRLEDVMHYKQTIDQEREAALDELVQDAQENDMGYGKR
jgi:excisionase family DNA binding protein